MHSEAQLEQTKQSAFRTRFWPCLADFPQPWTCITSCPSESQEKVTLLVSHRDMRGGASATGDIAVRREYSKGAGRFRGRGDFWQALQNVAGEEKEAAAVRWTQGMQQAAEEGGQRKEGGPPLRQRPFGHAMR